MIHLSHRYMTAAKSLQSCPTLCDRPHPWDSPCENTGVGCHFLLQRIKVKSESEVTQSCRTLQDPMDCSPPGSSVHGIFQARVLEWGAIAFSEVHDYCITIAFSLFPPVLESSQPHFLRLCWVQCSLQNDIIPGRFLRAGWLLSGVHPCAQ